jgi:RND superfamily putative drug exporter
MLLAPDQVRAEFISPDHQAMRLSVVLKISPLTRAAMNDAPAIAQAARDAAAAAHLDASIQLTGATAEVIDLRDTTHLDFWRIAVLSLLAILIVVWAILRDLLIAIFILAATVLSYLTTLGLTYWVFQSLGSHGLEWKVQMLLFIVLVAVGQDYSIFLALRLAQEARGLPCRQAMHRAVIFTGPVISSCGLIMAATLGSVMAGDVQLLVQLGFAFALGMLIDTFIVRPLLLPSLIVLTGRTLQGAAVGSAFHAPEVVSTNPLADTLHSPSSISSS